MKEKKKFVSLHLLNLIISFFNVQSEQLNSYSIQKNHDVDQTIASNWLISQFNVHSRINCLTACNLNSLCLNLGYNTIQGTCSLYCKEFV